MMLIPKLRSRPTVQVEDTIAAIDQVLTHYERVVVFANLNLRLNLLWVTVRPVPGICLELPTAIKLRVPEALLVGQKVTP